MASAGSDTLDGDYGNDVIYGYGGADFISGGWGNDRIYGGSGHDTIAAGPEPSDITEQSYADADEVWSDDGDDYVLGGWGNDWLMGGQGNDTLIGGSGGDWLIGGTRMDGRTSIRGTTFSTATTIHLTRHPQRIFREEMNCGRRWKRCPVWRPRK
ncbi:MAG: calcium-binding protein [Planctomycetaceae bacterium]